MASDSQKQMFARVQHYVRALDNKKCTNVFMSYREICALVGHWYAPSAGEFFWTCWRACGGPPVYKRTKHTLPDGTQLRNVYKFPVCEGFEAPRTISWKDKLVDDAPKAKPKRASRKRGKNSREKVCAFRMTDSEFAAVERALKKVNPKPGVEDGPAYAPADFYRAAALALLADAGSHTGSDIALVREWLAEAQK